MTGPHRRGSWVVDIGTLGEYFRGEKTLHSKKFVIEHCDIDTVLLFSRVASGVVAKVSN